MNTADQSYCIVFAADQTFRPRRFVSNRERQLSSVSGDGECRVEGTWALSQATSSLDGRSQSPETGFHGHRQPSYPPSSTNSDTLAVTNVADDASVSLSAGSNSAALHDDGCCPSFSQLTTTRRTTTCESMAIGEKPRD